MRIAISTEGDRVSAHFGRCPVFTVIDFDQNEGIVTNRFELQNPGHAPGAVPNFLHSQGVEVIVCGGMGNKAFSIFSGLGVQTMVGIEGNINETIDMIKKGTLKGGLSLCSPGAGKGYGIDKSVCDHGEE